MMGGGRWSESHILVLPRHKLIYVAIPKAASTRIRKILARAEGRFSRSLRADKRSRYRGPYGPRNKTIGSVYRVATDSAALRFSFVRNPYARAVSCRADKFAGKPLVGGDPFIDAYPAARRNIDARLPSGAHACLSFAEFVAFVAGAAEAHNDSHIQSQSNILDIPGMQFDFIGRVESFGADFARVLDHLKVSDDERREAATLVNESHHDSWQNYYTRHLADCIYRAYEQDFDQFRYARCWL